MADLSVNGPLVAEMFNILGFHVSRNYDEAGDINDNRRTVNEEVKQLYDRAKSKIQEDQEAIFEERGFTSTDNLQEELTPQDLRILIKSEEELHQANMFSRIFPCKDYNQ